MKSAMTQSISSILDYVSRQARERWNQDLVSVVLFGSWARGDARERSDVDLLLVVERLPEDWRQRSQLELSFERLGLGLGKALQVILVEPEEVSWAVNSITPLLLEIHTAFHCLFDRADFFQGEMDRLTAILAARGVRRVAESKWEVPELAEA